jgi:phosphatidylinositol-bisphosphatase
MLPQDIRLLNTPLLERLSPSSAGMVGDDHADAQLIKEDWVRREARRAAITGRRRLK